MKDKELNQEIIAAEKKLQALRNKQYAQQYELPPLEKRAKELVGYGYSDAYIQSKLYASRTPNVGIDDIVAAIEKARNCNAVLK